MDQSYQAINETLVRLFHEIMDIEQEALTGGEFSEVSVNDMHIIEAIGVDEPKNMSTVAKALSVTVGTLTIAVNSLVKKGYIVRVRSQEDRRVVLLSLTEKGTRAYNHHHDFHEKMVQSVTAELDGEELQVLVKVLQKLKGFFHSV